MKVAILVVAAAFLGAGCVSTGPAISKSRMGNVEIQVIPPEGVDVRRAEIHVDGVFIGNATDRLPVLQLATGKREIGVQMPGCRPASRRVTILGYPNHQVVNVFLEREGP